MAHDPSPTQETLIAHDDAILKKLKRALRLDGDFPVRAKLVTDLKILASKPNTSIRTITEIILKEPALGSRVLHLVNSAYYQRSRPITTISHAVVHMGMMALCDLCAGLVLLQKFRPAAKHGGFFAENLKKSILISLISNKLASSEGDAELAEHSYLAGSFYSLGPLLLAYYFPQVYDLANRRSQMRKQGVEQSIYEILGTSPKELGLAILVALKIPDLYLEIFAACFQPLTSTKEHNAKKTLSHIVPVAAAIADAIINQQDSTALEHELALLAEQSAYSEAELTALIQQIPEEFTQHCQLIDLSFLSLPEYFTSYVAAILGDHNLGADTEELLPASDTTPLDELKTAFNRHQPFSNIIGQALETIVYTYEFDRALLLRYDQTHQTFHCQLAIGQWYGYNTKELEITPKERPLYKLCRQTLAGREVIYSSAELFQHSYDSVLVPLAINANQSAIIYCDHSNRNNWRATGISAAAKEYLQTLSVLIKGSTVF